MEDKPRCHVCGTARKRNLIVSYTAKRKGVLRAVYAYILGGGEELYKRGLVDRHVICYRCSMLGLSEEQKYFLKDRFFGRPTYRYKNLLQKVAANEFKRDESDS